MLFVVLLFGAEAMRPAFADGMTRGTAAYNKGDYARAARELIPAAARGKHPGSGTTRFHVRIRLRVCRRITPSRPISI